MKYAAEMDSGGMIYLPSFITIDSAIEKLIQEGYTYRHRYTHIHKTQQGDFIYTLFIFSK
jgi:hypothetical protein